MCYDDAVQRRIQAMSVPTRAYDNPIETMMNPASIAFVGASNNLTTMGTIQCLNLVTGGYTGEVLPVHPTEPEVLGLKAYPSVDALPKTPELAVLVVPTRLVLELVEAFGRIGTKRMVIVTAGFRETGDDGRSLEQTLVERARHYGIRFLGPNCLGIVNTSNRLNITVGPVQDFDGALGIASQSGTYVAQVVSYLHRNGVALSKAISVGNEADINIVDCIEYLGADERTKAIGLYIEGIKDVGRFLETASLVSRDKPIVAQYVGGSEAGARSCASHTGAMAGPAHLYEALFEQAGVIQVESIEDVYRIGSALATQPRLKGRRIAVLTNSGGPGTAIANTCDRLGLEVPEFSPGLKERIAELIPGHASAKNPIDLTFHMDMKVLSEEIPSILFESEEVDGVIIHGIMDTGFLDLLYPAVSRFMNETKEQLFEAMSIGLDRLVAMPSTHGKPLLISSFFGLEDHCVRTFHERRIPTFDAPEKAARAMGAFLRHLEIRNRPVDRQGRIGSPPEEATAIVKRAGGAGLDEYDAKALLRSYGIPTPVEVRVSTLAAAREAARSIGFPVALKACAPEIRHKTELGLVRLGIASEDELERAYRSMSERAGVPGFIVAEMLRGERELMAGVTRHPGFPPCVVLGLGGVFAEALEDISSRFAPLSATDAHGMMDGLRSSRLLGPFRGMKAVDRVALSNILVALGRLALHFPHIAEVDLNPIIVVDGSPIVADALVVLGEGDTEKGIENAR
ncbi:MAG TPA: acetate--CoA ligase family protein [Deltaproteobacteria bacterium]|nr:acetate--CoA ligase family protein [Deltaproteobacteria bacterium]